MDPFLVGDVDQVSGTLEPVKLPSGMSLFGLLSMKADEAKGMIKRNNPDFEVVVTNASDETSEPRFERKLVRLLVDDDAIVVDVLRS